MIRDAQGNVAWDGGQFAFIRGAAPGSVNPSLWRQEQLNNQAGLFKVAAIQVPATKKRFGKNPFTGVDQWFAAKPASVKVKVRPLKKLKDAAL